MTIHKVAEPAFIFLYALVATAAVHAQPLSTSQIINGYTGGKLMTLPGPVNAECTIVDQVVLDTNYGGSEPGYPDVIRLLVAPDGEARIDIVKTDPDAIDYGVLITSEPMELDGDVVALAATASQTDKVWVVANGDIGSNVSEITLSELVVARSMLVGEYTAVDLAAVQRQSSEPVELFIAVADGDAAAVVSIDIAAGKLLQQMDGPVGVPLALGVNTIGQKSVAVGAGENSLWVLLAVENGDGPQLVFLNDGDPSKRGGPVKAPGGRIHGIVFANTIHGGLDTSRPDIFVSYQNGEGDNLISVYDSFSNNSLGIEYPHQDPRGELVGLQIVETNHDLGPGDPGHPVIIYAVNPR